ncbi:MAG: hypothetical protein PSN36_03550 [Gammaproteobacteria bacterium]|nr:hypothetical protein [Gammaproteobacteria bacterium]
MMKELYKADEVIRDSITSCYPREWDENHITYTWLSRLRNHAPKIPFSKHSRINVIWDAYKMKGQLEQDNGDVAFIVKVTFKNGNSLSGVAFLEAKRIYENGKYDALKWEQLKHMTSNSSHHHLLLYDFQAQEIPNTLPCGCCYWDDCLDSKRGIGIVIPTLHALTYEEKDRSLASVGYRLSEQIFLRYFRGLDLNFDQTLVENVKAGIAGGVQYLAVAHVMLSDEVNVELSLRDVQPNEGSGFHRLNANNEQRG